MNNIRLSDGTIYNVCNENWSAEHIGFTVVTDDVAMILGDMKDKDKTKHIEWLDKDNNQLGEWNNFTDLKGFSMEQNVCTGVEIDENGQSKGNTYAEVGYTIILNKVEPEYVSREEYEELLNAMLELASIVGGES